MFYKRNHFLTIITQYMLSTSRCLKLKIKKFHSYNHYIYENETVMELSDETLYEKMFFNNKDI